MYNFYNKTDVETAVNKLAAAANNGELYVIADEAFFGSDITFSEFVTHLSNRVPSLHLWAAAVDRVRVPSCVSVETLTRPLRCPPAVQTEVGKSEWIDGHLQYRDTIILCAVPRDDPPVVSRLRARGVPVQVVTSRDDEAAIRNVALSTDNQVTVTDWMVVSGLERRVVVVRYVVEKDV
nr:hypothetical protein BaRGS_024177 [Batillaria attramentaria]